MLMAHAYWVTECRDEDVCMQMRESVIPTGCRTLRGGRRRAQQREHAAQQSAPVAIICWRCEVAESEACATVRCLETRTRATKCRCCLCSAISAAFFAFSRNFFFFFAHFLRFRASITNLKTFQHIRKQLVGGAFDTTEKVDQHEAMCSHTPCFNVESAGSSVCAPPLQHNNRDNTCSVHKTYM